MVLEVQRDINQVNPVCWFYLGKDSRHTNPPEEFASPILSGFGGK